MEFIFPDNVLEVSTGRVDKGIFSGLVDLGKQLIEVSTGKFHKRLHGQGNLEILNRLLLSAEFAEVDPKIGVIYGIGRVHLYSAGKGLGR
jgi:hypothetical protein